jgi:hypothetical protein
MAPRYYKAGNTSASSLDYSGIEDPLVIQQMQDEEKKKKELELAALALRRYRDEITGKTNMGMSASMQKLGKAAYDARSASNAFPEQAAQVSKIMRTSTAKAKAVPIIEDQPAKPVKESMIKEQSKALLSYLSKLGNSTEIKAAKDPKTALIKSLGMLGSPIVAAIVDPSSRATLGSGINSATLGASDYLMRKFAPSTSAKMQAERAKYPIASTVGDIAGYLAPGSALTKATMPLVKGIASVPLRYAVQEGAIGAGMMGTRGIYDNLETGKTNKEVLKAGAENALWGGGTGFVGGGLLGVASNVIKKGINARRAAAMSEPQILDASQSQRMLDRPVGINSVIGDGRTLAQRQAQDLGAFEAPATPPQGLLTGRPDRLQLSGKEPRLQLSGTPERLQLTAPYQGVGENAFAMPQVKGSRLINNSAESMVPSRYMDAVRAEDTALNNPAIVQELWKYLNKNASGAAQTGDQRMLTRLWEALSPDERALVERRVASRQQPNFSQGAQGASEASVMPDAPINPATSQVRQETSYLPIDPTNPNPSARPMSSPLMDKPQTAPYTPPVTETLGTPIETPPVLPLDLNQLGGGKIHKDLITAESIAQKAAHAKDMSYAESIASKAATIKSGGVVKAPPTEIVRESNLGLQDFNMPTRTVGAGDSIGTVDGMQPFNTSPSNKIKIDPTGGAQRINAKQAFDMRENIYTRGAEAFESGGKIRLWVNNTLLNADATSPEVKAYLRDNLPQYEPITNAEAWNKAWTYVDSDFNSALAQYKNSATLDNADDAMLGQALQLKLMMQGDVKGAGELGLDFAARATQLGQTMQALSQWRKLSPAGWLQGAKRMIDDANKEVSKVIKKPFDPNKIAAKGEADNFNPYSAKTEGKINNTVNKTKTTVEMTKEDEDEIMRLARDYFTRLTPEQRMTREGQVIMGEYSKIVKKYIDPDWADKLKSMQRVNLLLNTMSNAKNIGSNISMVPISVMSQSASAFLDKILTGIAKAFPAFAEHTGISNVRTTFQPSPSAKSLTKGIGYVWEDMKRGIDTSGGGGAFDLSTSRPNAWQDYRASANPVKKAIGEIYGRGDTATTTALKMGDKPFYQLHFDDIMMGYKKYALKVAKEQNIPNINSVDDIQVPMDYIQHAHEEALQRTYQDFNELSQTFSKIQDVMNVVGWTFKSGQRFGLGNIVLPFKNTIANVMKRTLDHSIGGTWEIGKQLINAAKGNGKFDQYQFVKSAGQVFTGYGLLTLGWALASMKLAEGNIPADKDARLFKEQRIKTLPYSMKMPNIGLWDGDRWIQFDWAQPSGAIIAMGVDMYDAIQKQAPEKSAVLTALGSGAQSIMNNSLLQGVAKLFGGNEIGGNSTLPDNIGKVGISSMSQFAPFGSAVGQLNRSYDLVTGAPTRGTDDPSATTKYGINPAMLKVPFGQLGLPPKVDTWGESIPATNAISNWLLPGKMQDVNPTRVDAELNRMYDESGLTSQFPQYIPFDIKQTKKGITREYSMNAQERVYYQQKFGQMAKASVAEYMASPEFRAKTAKQDDAGKAKDIASIYTEINNMIKEDYLLKKGRVTKK